MKRLLLGLFLAALPLQFIAADPDEEKYFNRSGLKLTPQEQEALAIAKRWQGGGDPGKPIPGNNGEVTYVFGVQQPTIVCAVLQVCAIALQPGELVNSLQLGDTARWSVEPVVSGVGAEEILHLIVKPKDVGLQTSFIVATNRRIYHIRLLSDRTSYMPLVSFSYPEEVQQKVEQIKALESQSRAESTLPTGEYLGNLSFKYEVRGNAKFKPIRVFNDGKKTIIQMPSTLSQGEAPTLLVVRKDGRELTPDENVIVNYRLQNDRYIVDTVFDKAILIAGVGAKQDRITITRKTK